MTKLNAIKEKTDIDKLESVLCEAEKTAQKFLESEDGGTCNFDTPVVEIIGCTIKEINSMDYNVEKFKNNWYFVNIGLSGQGNRRTRMAESISKSLIESGFNSYVFYQMD